MIQLEDGSFQYISKTGHNETMFGKAIVVNENYCSVAEFKSAITRYETFVEFNTTLKQNIAALNAINNTMYESYNLLTNNCYHMVCNGFRAARIYTYPTNVPNNGLSTFLIHSRDYNKKNE